MPDRTPIAPMRDTATSVVLLAGAPTAEPRAEQLRLLARQLHLRPDVDLGVVWSRSGAERDAWPTYARRQLVFDDLRTWVPAASIGRLVPWLGHRLRGLEARRRFRSLGEPDVVVVDPDASPEVLARLAGGATVVALRWPGAEGPDIEADLVIAVGGARPAGTRSPVIEIPPPIDGRQIRSWAIPGARAEHRRTLPGEPRVLLAIGPSGDHRTAWADLAELAGALAGTTDRPVALGSVETDAPTTGLALVPQAVDDADDLPRGPIDPRWATTADLLVVRGPVEPTHPALAAALLGGTLVHDPAGHLDPSLAPAPSDPTQATPDRLARDGIDPLARRQRVSDARDRLDVWPNSERALVAIREAAA